MPSISHYLKRCKQLGFKGSFAQLGFRVSTAAKLSYRKHRAQRRKLQHTWKTIVRREETRTSFEDFFKQVQKQNFVTSIKNDDLFNKLIPCKLTDKSKRAEYADLSVRGIVTVLGSGQINLHEKGAWHFDAKYTNLVYKDCGAVDRSPRQANWQQQSQLYRKEIEILRNYKQDPDLDTYVSAYNPDIKVPWEISRLQHFSILADEYTKTGDQKYADAFVQQTTHWLNENPLLLGANWVCPMDVALRAISIIWALETFKHVDGIPQTFWKRLICSLYDHAWFIENNWEISERPGNHYLSDLIGYLYLSAFFTPFSSFKEKFETCRSTLIEQQKLQTHPDGSNYEGSTSYHKLVTEMFVHAQLLCREMGRDMPEEIRLLEQKSIQFLADCTDHAGNLIQIGDNDSGKMLTGIQAKQTYDKPRITNYPDFGLTILSDTNVHATLRHAVHKEHQPRGHHHFDALSTTLSYQGTQLIVDPGTYLYTASPWWRKKFISIEHHSTFHAPEELDNEPYLFNQPIPHHENMSSFNKNNAKLSADSQHTYYANSVGAHAFRRLEYDSTSQVITISDHWTNSTLLTTPIRTTWRFIFHPSVELKQVNQTTWDLSRDGKNICQLISTLPFKLEQSYYSAAYGEIEKTQALHCVKDVLPLQQIIHRFMLS